MVVFSCFFPCLLFQVVITVYSILLLPTFVYPAQWMLTKGNEIQAKHPHLHPNSQLHTGECI